MNILKGLPENTFSTEQENALALRNDEDAREELVLHAMREAFYYARGCYQGRSLSEGDVFSACYEGLMKAARRFRPDKIRFFGYAKADIRGALSKATRTLNLMKKPVLVEKLPDDDDEGGREDLGDSNLNVELDFQRRRIDKRQTVEPEFDAIYMKEEWRQIAPLLKTVLDDRERMVLELNFQGELNLQEIADLLDVTRSDMHHCRQVALKKIRNELMDQRKFSERGL